MKFENELPRRLFIYQILLSINTRDERIDRVQGKRAVLSERGAHQMKLDLIEHTKTRFEYLNRPLVGRHDPSAIGTCQSAARATLDQIKPTGLFERLRQRQYHILHAGRLVQTAHDSNCLIDVDFKLHTNLTPFYVIAFRDPFYANN